MNKMNIDYPVFSLWQQPQHVLLTLLIWGEARNQTEEGMRAVANVVLNRVKSKRFPNSIPAVILQTGEFQCFNNGNHNLDKMRKITYPNKNYEHCYQVAASVLSGEKPDNTDGSTYYWNPDICDPSWEDDVKKTVRIGDFQFAKEKRKGNYDHSIQPKDAKRISGFV